MNLGICTSSTGECGLSGARSGLRRRCLHFPCFLFSSISILFSRRFSSLNFFCLMRFRFCSSSGNTTAVRWSNPRRHIQAAKQAAARTCKRLQSLLGQDGRLEHQLADAELARERQVSQVAMAAADLLRPFQKRQVSCEEAEGLQRRRRLTSVTVCPTISTTAAVMESGLASRLPYSRSKQRMFTGCRNICWQSSAEGSRAETRQRFSHLALGEGAHRGAEHHPPW